MRIRSVLLVYKKKSRRPPHFRGGDPFVHRDLERFERARQAHRRTLEAVRRLLKARGIRVKSVYRARLIDYTPFDGVISVGGDGTFLEAARQVQDQWILGVNSDPKRSAGSFCAASGSDLRRVLDPILRGKKGVQRLNRLCLELNGQPLKVRALNDLLITHRKPAAMSRYWIQVGRFKEEQRSSGLWISTAAGSTGAIRSAGGRPIRRTSRAIQYRPRELYRASGFRYRLTGGVAPPGTVVRIGSLMPEGLICVDGEHVTFPFRYGDRLEVQSALCPLRVVL